MLGFRVRTKFQLQAEALGPYEQSRKSVVDRGEQIVLSRCIAEFGSVTIARQPSQIIRRNSYSEVFKPGSPAPKKRRIHGRWLLGRIELPLAKRATNRSRPKISADAHRFLDSKIVPGTTCEMKPNVYLNIAKIRNEKIMTGLEGVLPTDTATHDELTSICD